MGGILSMKTLGDGSIFITKQWKVFYLQRTCRKFSIRRRPMEGILAIGILFMKYLFVEEVPSIEDYINVRPSNALLGIEDQLEERSVDCISSIEALCVVPKTPKLGQYFLSPEILWKFFYPKKVR